MIAKRHSEAGKRSNTRANSALRLLRAVFNFAMARYEDTKGRPIILENPVKRLSQTRAWYRVDRRTSLIKEHELPAFFEGLTKLVETGTTSNDDVMMDYLLLLLFTGLRKKEAATIKWEYVDFKDKTLHIPDTKNNEPLTLSLSDYLIEMLESRFESRVNDYVFPGKSIAGYLTEPRRQVNKVIKHVQEATDTPNFNFMLHDLRAVPS